jgi:hypothetical protein
MQGHTSGPGDSDDNLDGMVAELQLNADGSRVDADPRSGEYIAAHEAQPRDPHSPEADHTDELQYQEPEDTATTDSEGVATSAAAKPQDRIKAFLAELPLALQGKSQKVSRNQALAVIVVIIAVPALLFMSFSPKPKAAPAAVTQAAPGPRQTATAAVPPRLSTRVPAAAASMALPAAAAAKTDAPKASTSSFTEMVSPAAVPAPSVATGWKPTAAGLDAKVEQILAGGPSPKVGSTVNPIAVPEAVQPSSSPAPAAHADSLASEAQQAQILKSVVDLKTSLDDIRKAQGGEANSIDELTVRVGSVETQIKTVASQLGTTQEQLQTVQAAQKQVETDTRPQLVVETVTIASGCASCSSVATATYQGSQLTLADGDTFLGFVVKLDANRVVLTKGSTVYTYMPEVAVP